MLSTLARKNFQGVKRSQLCQVGEDLLWWTSSCTGLTFFIIAHTDLKIPSSFYNTFSLPWYDTKYLWLLFK